LIKFSLLLSIALLQALSPLEQSAFYPQQVSADVKISIISIILRQSLRNSI
jgi:hypothetical protein